jgi:hypothetical protein
VSPTLYFTTHTHTFCRSCSAVVLRCVAFAGRIVQRSKRAWSVDGPPAHHHALLHHSRHASARATPARCLLSLLPAAMPPAHALMFLPHHLLFKRCLSLSSVMGSAGGGDVPHSSDVLCLLHTLPHYTTAMRVPVFWFCYPTLQHTCSVTVLRTLLPLPARCAFTVTACATWKYARHGIH